MRPLVLVPRLGCDDDLYAAQVQALADVADPNVPDITGATTIA